MVCQYKLTVKKFLIFSHFCLSGICANECANYIHFLSKQNISTSPPVKKLPIAVLINYLLNKYGKLGIWEFFFTFSNILWQYAEHENLADFHENLILAKVVFAKSRHLVTCNSVAQSPPWGPQFNLCVSQWFFAFLYFSVLVPFHPSVGVFASYSFIQPSHIFMTLVTKSTIDNVDKKKFFLFMTDDDIDWYYQYRFIAAWLYSWLQ
jgi:hypothetical protein